MFGDLDYDPSMAYAACSFEEQLEALSRAVEAGKVRVRCSWRGWVWWGGRLWAYDGAEGGRLGWKGWGRE